jgi:hypothetical protein
MARISCGALLCLRQPPRAPVRRIPGVLQGRGIFDDILLDLPLAPFREAQLEGLLTLQERGNVKFTGPLFALRLHEPEEGAIYPWQPPGHPRVPPLPLSVVRAKPVNILVHPLTERPVCVGFVASPVDAPTRVRVPVRPLNVEKCPGIKTGGWVNIRQRAVDIVVAPGAVPPLFATIDIGGLALKDRLPLDALQFAGKGDGCRLVLPGDTVSTVISKT